MHIFGGVEGDYRRGDAFKKRRALMDAWAVFATQLETEPQREAHTQMTT